MVGQTYWSKKVRAGAQQGTGQQMDQDNELMSE